MIEERACSMPLIIARESAGSPEAVALLQGRDAEVSALYTPEQSFRIPVEKHVRDDVIFLMARESGIAIGCGALQLHSGYGELKSMYVIPAARGKKLAQALVAALENLARERGFSEAKLETGIYSLAAIKTYERAGYARCERFDDYPFSPTSIFMTKNLS
jgi:putative acetyltransferase